LSVYIVLKEGTKEAFKTALAKKLEGLEYSLPGNENRDDGVEYLFDEPE